MGVALPHLVAVVVDRVHGGGGVASGDGFQVQRLQCRHGLETLLALRHRLIAKEKC